MTRSEVRWALLTIALLLLVRVDRLLKRLGGCDEDGRGIVRRCRVSTGITD